MPKFQPPQSESSLIENPTVIVIDDKEFSLNDIVTTCKKLEFTNEFGKVTIEGMFDFTKYPMYAGQIVKLSYLKVSFSKAIKESYFSCFDRPLITAEFVLIEGDSNFIQNNSIESTLKKNLADR